MFKIIMWRIWCCILLATAVSGGPISMERRPRGKIVGGEEAIPNSHPYIVSIQVDGKPYCGGTIISDRFILTAAHCATRTPKSYIVVAGEHDLKAVSGVEQAVEVAEVISHTGYRSSTNRHDIALFKLSTPLNFTAFVKAGLIANKAFQPYGSLETVGWGTTNEGGFVSDKLQQVRVRYVPDSTCKANYVHVTEIFEDMLCAGSGESGQDACQGDSGGPLNFVTADGQRILVGVTSFGLGCARRGYPGVYTEVGQYVDWIVETMEKHS